MTGFFKTEYDLKWRQYMVYGALGVFFMQELSPKGKITHLLFNQREFIRQF